MRPLALTALVIALWSITVPDLGRALGLSVDVPPRVEVVDHVVPGVVAVLASVIALAVLLRRTGGGLPLLFSAGLIALAGLWMTATHVPLLVQSARGVVRWGAALWHSSGGPVLLIAGLALFLGAPEAPRAK